MFAHFTQVACEAGLQSEKPVKLSKNMAPFALILMQSFAPLRLILAGETIAFTQRIWEKNSNAYWHKTEGEQKWEI
jgi:hypothetical protein